MGGVISRLLVSDTDLTQKLHTLGHKEQYKLINHLSADQRQTLSNRLVLSSLPQVDEAIFYQHLIVVQIMQIAGLLVLLGVSSNCLSN